MTIYSLFNDEQIVNGPRNWNYKSFEGSLKELEEELEITIDYTLLPLQKTDETVLELNSNLKIYPTQLTYDELNANIQFHNGPFWTFDNGYAIGNYVAQDKNLDQLKNELKEKVTANRYRKENTYVPVEVQNHTVSVDVSRGEREIYAIKYSLMADDETVNWKFPETWLTLTKADLGLIVLVGSTYIQDQFNWEKDTHANINSKVSLQELDGFDVGDEPRKNLYQRIIDEL
jgi:hypothetical protein